MTTLNGAFGVLFSPDGTRLAVLGTSLGLWNVTTRQKLWRAKPLANGSDMAFSPDGARLAVKSTTGQIAIVDVVSCDVLVHFRNKKDGEGSAPVWSPCGRYIIDGGWNGSLQVRDAATAQLLFRQDYPDDMLFDLQAIDGGQRLLVMHGVKSDDESARPPDYVTLWDWPLQAGAGRVVLTLACLMACAASPDGERLAALHHRDGATYLSVFAMMDGTLLDSVAVGPRGLSSHALQWLPDGANLGRIGKDKVEFYGWPGLALRRELPMVQPSALAFLPGSNLAAIGSWEKGKLMELHIDPEIKKGETAQ